MGTDIMSRLSGFASINLSELNATASYLKRIDRKYLLTEKQLFQFLEDFALEFKVLDIDGKRVFLYDNVYMDTNDYLFYKQHQEGKENRTKVRTRHYVDSGDLAFFEYKQKEDGITKKFRYQFPASEHGTMTKGKKRFFEGVYQSLYEEKAPEISPAIRTKYNRMTLVNRNGQERLTIDFNISIRDLRNKNAKSIKLKNLVIVESKSLSDDCTSSAIMQMHNIAQSNSCSKYSLGVVYSGLAEKWSRFEDTIEKIKEIRMEVTKNVKRIQSLEKVENTLRHNFTKTSLKEITQGVTV